MNIMNLPIARPRKPVVHAFNKPFVLAAVIFGTATSACLPQNCAPQPSGLVGWWRGEGTYSDPIGGITGSPTGDTSFVSGEVGLCFQFDGNGDAVQLGSPSSLYLQDFTIEAWIKRFSTSASSLVTPDAELFCFGAGGYGFGMWNDGRLFLTEVNVDNIAVGIGINDLNFHHVAVTKSGTLVIFYIDGVAYNVPAYNSTFSFSSDVAIGARGDNLNNSFFGLIDDLSVYNRALSASEIQSIYNAGKAGKCRPVDPPLIVTGPQGQTADVGAIVTFRALVAGDALSFQWHRYTTNLPGATNNSLVLTNVQFADAGPYSLFVSNSAGTATSSEAVLDVEPTPPCAAVPSGLVSWWSGQGTAADQFGTNDGIIVNNATFSAGEVELGFQFDGNGDAIALGTQANLQMQNFTIEGWVRRASLSASSLVSPDAELFSCGHGGYAFGMWSDGRLFLSKADFDNLPSTLTVSDLNFHHVAVTKTNGVVVFYIDGVSNGTPAYNSVFSFSTPVAIGARGDNFFNSFYGSIDEISIYSRALSQSEIQGIYNANLSGKCGIVPTILTQPVSQRVVPGTSVRFAADTRGNSPVYYQWRLNGSAIAGATSRSLVITNAQPSLAGNYSLRVTNSLGSAVSSNANLRVDVVFAFGNGLPLTNSQANFGGAVTIQLQNVYSNGIIFYTLDGSTPSFASTEYSAPFVITHNAVLRSLGYSADFFESGEMDPVSIQILPAYTLATTTSGGGSISLNPPGGSYLQGSTVNITATNAPGWTFLQWLGDVTGTNTTTSLVMTRNKSVRAVFGTTLNTTAAGNGTVSANPSGRVYPYGTVVSLSAIPQAGSYFALWGNAASGNTNPLSFLITNANPMVSSLFGSVAAGQASLTVVPIGKGQVSVNPRANEYTMGQGITITASPSVGQTFLGWSGDAGGAQNPLSTTMSQNKLIYAIFSENPVLSVQAAYEGLKPEGFVVTLNGTFGAPYQIGASTNLSNWTNLAILTNTFGTSQYLDFGATNFDHMFYRATLLQ
jgi:hypothetical protein